MIEAVLVAVFIIPIVVLTIAFVALGCAMASADRKESDTW